MKLFTLGLAAAAAMAIGTSTASAQYPVYPPPAVVVAPPPPVVAPGVAVGVAVPGVSVSGVIGGPPAVSVGIGFPFIGGIYRPVYGHPYYGPHFHGWRR
ncbi:MAG TPA: hypothetical protein VG097_05240 [Gemmata sp.]|jgi:hypothetical protein|nr:hypothetical protein [Gemmata sp.]